MTTVEKLQKYFTEIEKNDQKGNKINAFLHLGKKDELLEEAKRIDEKIRDKIAGKLAGKIIAVKSNINVKGMICSSASKTLENYKAPYDADVISKIKEEDGIIIGMTNMDEFASGSSGETSAFGPTKNPSNLNLISGGSSSGSAAAVAARFCDMALGSDTGGSVRNPASHCGVVGLKPSYGSVSRYGLIDLSMSLDQVGVFAKDINETAILFDIIKGKSGNDGTTYESKDLNFDLIEDSKKIKLGILDFKSGDKRIDKLIEKKTQFAAKRYGWDVKKVNLDYIDLAIETYYPLVYVEFFSGTRKLDGKRYGKKIEDVAGPEVLRRILGGSEISKAEFHGRYYDKSLRVKKMISDEFKKAFKKFDCIISPTVPRLPHGVGEKISVEDMYGYDALTIPSNLAGNCAVSIPIGKIEGIPVGLQIMCDSFNEQKLFEVARAFEKIQTE